MNKSFLKGAVEALRTVDGQDATWTILPPLWFEECRSQSIIKKQEQEEKSGRNHFKV